MPYLPVVARGVSDPARRIAFCISDRTGITVETLARSLLSQFLDVDFELHTLPFIDTPEEAEAAAEQIRAAAAKGAPPLVFHTLVDPELRARIHAAGGVAFDFFGTFLGPLEKALGSKAAVAVGRLRALDDIHAYEQRIEAINFTLATDDGLGTDRYAEADIVLVGVSRSGKTPVSLYLALHYGLRVANYPITEDDFETGRLPAAIEAVRKRVIGLLIDAQRLHEVRERRRPGSDYASLAQCRRELRALRDLYERYGIQYIDSTRLSVEELAASIVHRLRPSTLSR